MIETVETVSISLGLIHTPLKQGVNGKGVRKYMQHYSVCPKRSENWQAKSNFVIRPVAAILIMAASRHAG